jgi:uncharacterized protein (TIGR02147 family)
LISIFNYTDYRKFLTDYYADAKKDNPRFSYRYLTSLGTINPGNFAKIIKGERNLTLATTTKLGRALKLCKKERDYLQTLVLYCQSVRHEEKKRYFEEMMSFKESSVRILDADQYAFYDKWYYTAVREALAFYPLTKNNYGELGKFIIPAVPERDVGKAVDLLEKLGLVRVDAAGCVSRSDALISTGNNIKSLTLNNFVVNTMKLAENAINNGLPETNLSSVTLSVSAGDFIRIQDEVRAFRRKIMDIAKNSKNPNRVYQYNVQIFPLTKKYEGKKS